MEEKKRLYEIFRKVNRLNEDVFDNFNSDEMDDLRDEIVYAINLHFKIGSRNKMFKDGIPEEMNINVKEKEIEFTLDEQNPLEMQESVPEQVNYNANYNGEMGIVDDRLKNVQAKLFVPVTVNLNKKQEGGKIDFWTEIWINSEEVEVEFERK